ncbi:MAG: hypothetical protein KBC73_03830 [Burkholderiaceae bacterium]|nr:hypothetical protein [Burkholderiaceae bacterium]
MALLLLPCVASMFNARARARMAGRGADRKRARMARRAPFGFAKGMLCRPLSLSQAANAA